MRSKKQKFWDYLSLLRLYESVNEISSVDGNLKAQKLPFLAEWKGIEVGIQAFHLTFFRYNFGPFSKDLVTDIEFLTKRDILNTSRKLTKKGKFLLEFSESEMRRTSIGRIALEIIDEVVNEYGRKSGPTLRDLIYTLKVPVYDYGNEYRKVRDIRTFIDIFFPTEMKNLREIPLFSDDTLKVIEEELNLPMEYLNPANPSYQRTVRSALRRVKEVVNA